MGKLNPADVLSCRSDYEQEDLVFIVENVEPALVSKSDLITQKFTNKVGFL